MSDKKIDWPGLLKWSLSYSDGTAPTSEMSLERLRFLEEALAIAMKAYEDPVDLVKEAVQKLKTADLENDEVLMALRVIQKCVDVYPEISRLLTKLGVTEILLNLSQHKFPDIENISLEILAFGLSNNLNVQLDAWKSGCLDIILNKKNELTGLSWSVLSSLLRHAKDIQIDFLKNFDGYNVLVKGLCEKEPRMFRKAATIVQHLAYDHVFEKEKLDSVGIYPVINKLMLQKEDLLDVQSSEIFIAAVKALIAEKYLPSSTYTRESLIKAFSEKFKIITPYKSERSAEYFLCREAIEFLIGKVKTTESQERMEVGADQNKIPKALKM